MSRTVTVPDWLNESFLQTVLQQDQHRNRDVKVNSVEVTQAVPPGANYASVLFRVRGRYQVEDDADHVNEISVIVKALITADMFATILEECGIMEKEYMAYREFLPEVYRVLPESELFTAKLLYSSGPKTLVLEDLKGQGFVMADRLKQLDFQHCLICMKTLARFHAASVAVIKKKPEFITTLGKESVYHRDNKERYGEMGKAMAIIFIKAVKTWEGFEDFEEMSGHVWESLEVELCEIFEPRKDSLNVMNHGDLWLNNMMFKYNNDGNIVDFRLVDFQMCRYGTPVTDLLYFLFTSANQEVREKRLGELLSVYLETLNSVLEELACEERLTREQLDAELKRSQCYIFVIIYGALGMVLSDPDDLMNLDEFTEESTKSENDNPIEKIYYGKYYKDIAPKVMRYLCEQGFFERHKISK